LTGSLATLQGLGKLKVLLVNSTQLAEGLEYLPENLEYFICEGCGESLVEQLKDYYSDGGAFSIANASYSL
jgi:hypothetical protein